MMRNLAKIRGFTLTEVLFSVGLIAIMAALGTVMVVASQNKKRLEGEAVRVASQLRSIQNRSVEVENGKAFGVQFWTSTTPNRLQFVSSEDEITWENLSGTRDVYVLPERIRMEEFENFTMSGSFPEIRFEKRSGAAKLGSPKASFKLKNDRYLIKISITSFGIVEIGLIEKI